MLVLAYQEANADEVRSAKRCIGQGVEVGGMGSGGGESFILLKKNLLGVMSIRASLVAQW